MKVRREHRIVAATAALAVGVPVGAACWIGARTQGLADRLGERGGIQASIGDIDADLTGTIRLRDVALGELFASESIEASVALDSLLAGIKCVSGEIDGPAEPNPEVSSKQEQLAKEAAGG